MTNLIKLKRSAVANAVPTTAQLDLGELAINTNDGKLYLKKNDGTESIVLTNPAPGNGLNLVNDEIVHADTSSVADVTAAARTYVTGLTFDQFGHVTGASTAAETVTDTTYSVSAETVTGGANLRLTSSGASTDDVKIASGTNITVSRTDANTITVTGDDQIAAHVAAADPHTQYTTLTDIASVTGDIHGIVDRTASTLSFVDATRTFSITPVSGSWTFYHKGELKTVTGARSIQIANTAGARFIRIDPTTLNLIEGGSVPDFVNDTIVAYIYYDTTAAKALIVGDERHGVNRDTTWHSNQHLNVGTIWRSGGTLGYTLSSQAAIQLDVGTPLLIADEDLLHTITHSATPTADYQQILTTAASLEVLYLSGTTYTSTTQSTTPWVAGTARARYNLVNAGSGSLVDASEGHYITYWLIATNDIRRPVKLVMGRASHATIDAAYAEEFQEYGISFAEQVFMYQIVLQTSTTYTSNTPHVVVAAVRKVTSKVAATASTATAQSHGTLTGRDAADSHTIGAVTGLQTALDGKQASLVSGTNIKTVNGTTLLGSGDLTVTGASKDYFTFGGTGVPTTGAGLTPYIRVMNTCTCVNASLVAKTAPSGGSFVVSILRSADNGATFPTTVGTITMTTGNRVGTVNTTTALSAGDLLRLDISSVNGAADWTAQLYAVAS
jgi:hypothetical protein